MGGVLCGSICVPLCRFVSIGRGRVLVGSRGRTLARVFRRVGLGPGWGRWRPRCRRLPYSSLLGTWIFSFLLLDRSCGFVLLRGKWVRSLAWSRLR